MEPLMDTIKRRGAQGCDPSIALLELLAAKTRLVVTRDNPNRLCELAAVAGTGQKDMPENEVVAARRAYAASLGVMMSGPIKDSDKPAYINHAVDHSDHNPNARNRTNLGSARVFGQNGRFCTFIPELVQHYASLFKTVWPDNYSLDTSIALVSPRDCRRVSQ